MISTSEHVLYAGMYLPGERKATPVGLLTLGRRGVNQYGDFAYGLRYRAHLDAVLKVASHFGLSNAAASAEIKRIGAVVAGWKAVFAAAGADDGLIRRVAHCFKAQAKLATR